MHDLYAAVEILGRSVDDVDRFGWGHCTLGQTPSDMKCVNGTLSIATSNTFGFSMGKPLYAYATARQHTETREPLRIAQIALLRTVPQDIAKVALDGEWNENVSAMLAKYEAGTLDLDERIEFDEWLGSRLVEINDEATKPVLTMVGGKPVTIKKSVALLGKDEARAWYMRALDLLAKELPEPLNVLTVDDIVSTPMIEPDCTGYVCDTHKSLQHDGDTCPIHEAV